MKNMLSDGPGRPMSASVHHIAFTSKSHVAEGPLNASLGLGVRLSGDQYVIAGKP
jgi:hypothetical protein